MGWQPHHHNSPYYSNVQSTWNSYFRQIKFDTYIFEEKFIFVIG